METEYPLVTIESLQEVHVELDPATRQVVAAIKAVTDTELDDTIRYVTALYLPEYTVTYVYDGGLVEISRDDHCLDEVAGGVDRERGRSLGARPQQLNS